jgi:hypothetical protein
MFYGVQKMNRKLFAALLGLTVLSIFLVPMSLGAEPELATRGRPIGDPSTCTITSPSNGDTISGSITITVEANKVPSIYVDGVKIGRASSLSWDTTTVADGNHVIRAVNRDTVDELTVTVDNGGGGGDPGTGDGVIRKWALVIGISDYEGTSSDLTYCDDDANDWAAYLQGEGYTVVKILDQQATYSNIMAKLQDLADDEDGDDMIAVTYSGHGYYDKVSRQSGWVSHDLYLVAENDVEAITDTFESTCVFWFDDCCNIGTYQNLANDGWVMGQGSTTRTYTYDGDSTMKNGIYTYYAMIAIDLGYTTAEDICTYAATEFNAATPGSAYTVDKYSGDLEI